MHKHIHFIGIGGIGMSAIASILLRRSINVSGSDLKETKILKELGKSGARIFIGHSPINVNGADLVVRSSAIRNDNPELIEAKRQNIPVIKRAEALLSLMEDKFVITVSGSHGKTTTSALVSYLLSKANLSPTAAIGGLSKNTDTNTYIGEGRFFVAEADESDGSFLCYNPRFSIITNIDYEHLDYYENFENEIESFKKFIDRTYPGGCVFGCADDINLKNILNNYKNKCVLFGLSDTADIYPKNIMMKGLSSEFDCSYKGKFVGRFFIGLGGMHNISNSLSVIALGLELGIEPGIIKDALAGYKGTGRRIEVKFENKDYLVIDDYAHHPTEIKATLKAVRNVRRGNIIAVFQPHRYSRTKLLLDEFAASFDTADCVMLTEIYAAGESPLENVSARDIYDKMKQRHPGKKVQFIPKQELVKNILKVLKPDDLVITLGAGDITKICDELVEELKR